MKNYFDRKYESISDLRTHYYELAKTHHPDMGGSTEAMKSINAQYEKLYDRVVSGQYKNFDSWSSEFKQKFHTNDVELRTILDALVMVPEIIIEVCGIWVWVTGETKKYKQQLKDLEMRFSGKKLAWYWHPKGWRKANRNEWSLDEIRGVYGSEKIEKDENIGIDG